MIITISRQYGAGGAEIAARVAEALHWRLVDNELVDEVARRAGLPREEVVEREERAPGFLERLARALSRSAPELFSRATDPPEPSEAALVRVTESVVEELAAGGRVVLVGRAAPAVLARDADALHVKVVAPELYRTVQAAAREGIPAHVAERRRRESDANRARYHRDYYRRDWDDAATYHLVLNAEALGVEGATRLVVEAARLRWPELRDRA